MPSETFPCLRNPSLGTLTAPATLTSTDPSAAPDLQDCLDDNFPCLVKIKSHLQICCINIWMFPKIVVPPIGPNHPLKNRIFHEINHPFRGTPIFGNTHIYKSPPKCCRIWYQGPSFSSASASYNKINRHFWGRPIDEIKDCRNVTSRVAVDSHFCRRKKLFLQRFQKNHMTQISAETDLVTERSSPHFSPPAIVIVIVRIVVGVGCFRSTCEWDLL